MCLSICPSACLLPACLYIIMYLSICLPAYLYIIMCLSICLSASLPVACLPVYNYVPVHLSTCLSVCLLPAYLYIIMCLSICLPTCCLPACCLPTCLPAGLPLSLCPSTNDPYFQSVAEVLVDARRTEFPPRWAQSGGIDWQYIGRYKRGPSLPVSGDYETV